jgi:phospholipase/carboxylesterase
MMTAIHLAPSGGAAPKALIICLHGVGADAESLRPLGQLLQLASPTSAVIIPDAPAPFDMGGSGRQWFSVGGVTDQNRAARIESALPWLEQFILNQCNIFALDPKYVAVCGFSQGAMMALSLASSKLSLAAIVSIAGRIARPIGNRMDVSTRIMLTHGDLDLAVPFASMNEAARSFGSAGFKVHLLPIKGLGHTINQQQADATRAFIAQRIEIECTKYAAVDAKSLMKERVKHSALANSGSLC